MVICWSGLFCWRYSFIFILIYSDLGDFQCSVYVVYVHKVVNNSKPQISKIIKVSIKKDNFNFHVLRWNLS